MKKNNLLKATTENCIVFGGGEPTLLKEFDKLIDLFCTENFNNIRINSSGIKYSKALANALKNNISSLVISIDSGTKNKYKQIKRVNAFDIVVKNIDRYIKNSKYSKNLILKYILIPGVNTNKEEIDNFFQLVLKHNIQKVSISVEQTWYHRLYPNFPNYIYYFIDYFTMQANKYSIENEIYCEAINVLKFKKRENNDI